MEVLTAGRLLHAACLSHISVSVPLKILTRQQRIIALVVQTHTDQTICVHQFIRVPLFLCVLPASAMKKSFPAGKGFDCK
jgi:hypothetical protein